MVLVKRMLNNNGFNGYRPPVVPRAPRSIRKRSLLRERKVEGNQICPFELLATVAGKLLEETECSSASSSAAVAFDKYGIGKDGVKEEPHDDQGSSEGSVHFSGNQKGICKEKVEAVNGEHVSPVASSVCSEKDHPDSKLRGRDNHDGIVKLSSKIIRDFSLSREFDDTNVETELNKKLDINGGASGDFIMANKSTVRTKNVEFPFLRDSAPNDSFLKHVNDVKIVCKDDDEILSRCSQPNNTRKIFKSPTRIGDRRFRKLLTSKYWETSPKLKDCEPTQGGGAVKHGYDNKRPCYEIDRSQRNTPFKKRRLFDRSSIVTYDGGISCESVSNSPEKSRDEDYSMLAGKLREGNGKLSSGFRSQNSCNSRDSHVRLCIKSFKVPELFVEVPESTTVGSLKRTVLEAVTSILGGGLRVGILLQGKKIRDDNRTLLQAGISQNDAMDTVGFMLEPSSPTQPSPLISPKEPPATLLCDSPKFAHRSQVNLKKDMFLLGSLDKPSVIDSNSPTGSSRDLVPSDTKELPQKKLSDSKALVPVPEASMEALAVLPMDQRAKPSEIGHRRTRRPFSVSEVEALVYAVEKLGTGRWRDVKIRSFDNATHRTYVDLKDKWKTLVHTARIAPQQRRGEPVPQELLDRVLAAQSYWSEHQAKNHGKQHQHSIIPKLTDSVA